MVTAPRRRMVWTEFSFEAIPSAGGQADRQMVTQLPAEKKGFTVARMLLELYMQPSTAAANARLAVGIAVISGDANLANVFPDPGDEEQFPWLYRAEFSMIRDIDAGPQGVYRNLDIRAKRIFRSNGDVLVFIADADAASSWKIDCAGRVLFHIA